MSKVVCTATTGPEGDQSADTRRITGIGDQRLDKRMVDSTIVECRLFFTPGEDCYLPGIVTALQSLITPEQAKARRSLKQHVAQVVVGPRMGASGPIFHSGRLEMDNGLGPGILLGSVLVAMDYIEGIALGESHSLVVRRYRLRTNGSAIRTGGSTGRVTFRQGAVAVPPLA